MIIPASRLLWLDALRAFLALGVAFHHVNLESEDMVSWANGLLVTTRVPCFYFLAGYFVGCSLSDVNLRTALSHITRRFRQLIVPAIIFLLLVDFSKIHALKLFSFQENFFLNSLFWSSTLVIMSVLVCRLAHMYRWRIYILLLLAATACLLLFEFSHLNIPYFDLNCTLHSIIFVVGGYWIGSYKYIPSVLTSPTLILFAGGIYLTCEMSDISMYMPETIYKVCHRIILPYIGIYAIFGGFFQMRKWFRSDTVQGKIAFYLGQRSLPLYVIIWVCVSTFDIASMVSQSLPQGLRSVIIFLCATALSLLLHDVMCCFPWVSRLVFGRKHSVRSPFLPLRIQNIG